MNRTAGETLALATSEKRPIVGQTAEYPSVTTNAGREKLLLARQDHSVLTVNVLVVRGACEGLSHFGLTHELDAIMVLEAMSTFVSRGTLRNVKTRESWSWSLSNILDAAPTIRSSFFSVSWFISMNALTGKGSDSFIHN